MNMSEKLKASTTRAIKILAVTAALVAGAKTAEARPHGHGHEAAAIVHEAAGAVGAVAGLVAAAQGNAVVAAPVVAAPVAAPVVAAPVVATPVVAAPVVAAPVVAAPVVVPTRGLSEMQKYDMRERAQRIRQQIRKHRPKGPSAMQIYDMQNRRGRKGR